MRIKGQTDGYCIMKIMRSIVCILILIENIYVIVLDRTTVDIYVGT